MAEELQVSSTKDKQKKYQELEPQLVSLLADEPDLYAKMANMAAALRQTFNFFWVGFYLVKPRHTINPKDQNKNELVLGPFQGPIACTRIAYGRGVCGATWAKKASIIVPDVEKFPGHIACNSASKSEIVVPGIHGGEVHFVLDVDSDCLEDFDEVDQYWLERFVALL